MRILKEDLHRILDPYASLTLMGDDMLERIVQDPGQPLMGNADKGYGLEAQDTYDRQTSLLDICRQGRENGAKRLDVSFDFFFGGDKRESFPDSPLTVQAYQVIHDVARSHGMGFAASVVSPLDTGGEYVKTHEHTGQTMQFREGNLGPDGAYGIKMDLQQQWTNNKGPVKLQLKEVKVFAFDEERIPDTPFYYVDPQAIVDISHTAHWQVDEASCCVSQDGYGHGDIHISGVSDCGKSRFLAVLVYRTQEIDYFAPDALDYMKSILDLHQQAGITYDGIYSDEMHIQFDWNTADHWAETEVNTRYMTASMAREYARLYGAQYGDFAKFLVYFTYGHDFLDGEEGAVPAQHVFGKGREAITETFLFRKRYFELLHSRVVSLCVEAKNYAQTLFGRKMQATGHSTWQESPTADSFRATADGKPVSHYDYTDAFAWSAAHRENMAACNDHFKWNDYFWAVGTDIPEGGGYLDRNYYGAAFTAGLSVLNPAAVGYYCVWGAPDAVKERLTQVGQAYGHYAAYCSRYELGHHMIQGYTTRISDVLAVYPVDLNHLDERFGNWMVQYGYADYITEEKLLQYAREPESALLRVKDRDYRAVVVFFSPLMSGKTLSLLRRYVQMGGKVIWCSMPALQEETSGLWREMFGIDAFRFPLMGVAAKQESVRFPGLNTVADMQILTDLFPDHVYPVSPAQAKVLATLGSETVGTVKTYPGGGQAVYLGFRPRDDQSCSTGEDISTLFDVLTQLGCYGEGSCEAASRPGGSPYLSQRFPNGSFSLCNHFRTFRELPWHGGFYRDAQADDAFMQNVTMPSNELDLQDLRICGRRITYRGEGILTCRYEETEGLLGFAGRNTCGICVDGKLYRFTDAPADLVWGRLDGGILSGEVGRAYCLKCSRPGKVTLPFDAGGMHCALCANHMLEPVEAYPFYPDAGQTVVEITPAAAGKWLVFYA